MRLSDVRKRYRVLPELLSLVVIPGIRQPVAWMLLLTMVSVAAVVAIPLLVRAAINTIGDGGATRALIIVIAAAAALDGIGRVLAELRFLAFARIEPAIQSEIIRRFVTRFFRGHHEAIERAGAGILVSALQTATFTTGQFAIGFFFVIMPVLMEFIFIIILVFVFLAPSIAFLFLLFCGLYLILVYRTAEGLTVRTDRAVRAATDLYAVISDVMHQKRLIKTDGVAAFAGGLVEAAMGRFAEATLGAWSYRSKLGLRHAMMILAFTLSTISFGSYLLDVGVISAGDHVMLLLYAMATTRPLDTLGRSLRDATRVTAALGALQDHLPAGPVPHPRGDGFPPRCDIEICHVTFCHDGEAPVLDDLSMTIAQGEKVCITGASGRGKTTLLHVLRGAMRPQAGAVRLGGVDLCSIDEAVRAERIVHCLQGAPVLDLSAYENIALGRAVHPAEVAAMMSALGLDQGSNPLDLGTRLGPDGSRISLGQKQRICLARAMLRPGDIFLYDEPTSALDDENAGRVAALLREVHATKTVVVVTHDPSLFNHFDRVIGL